MDESGYIQEKNLDLSVSRAYKEFMEERGIDIEQEKKPVVTPHKIFGYLDDQRSLMKAIEYGRSYRKDKKEGK